MNLSTARIVSLIGSRGVPLREWLGSGKGTIYLPTMSAIALWKEELLGQMSDGAWENAKPADHWRYWHDLDVELGRPGIKAKQRPLKTGYNFAGLFEYVGDRMLFIGKMGSVTDDPKCWEVAGSESMPPTLEQFYKDKAGSKSDYVKERLANVSDEVAEAYYGATYTWRDMARDLSQIKLAMKADPFTFKPGAVAGDASQGGASAMSSAQVASLTGPMKDGETRRLEKVDPEVNANKFWQVTLDGKGCSVSWGRIGSAGQSLKRNFSNGQQAAAWAQEMLASKLSKGYRPTAPDVSPRSNTVASGPDDTGEAGSAPVDMRRSGPRASATASGSYKVYPGGKGKPPVTRVKGQLYRGPAGSKAKPGSSYKVQPSGKGLKVSGDDWTQEWIPEGIVNESEGLDKYKVRNHLQDQADLKRPYLVGQWQKAPTIRGTAAVYAAEDPVVGPVKLIVDSNISYKMSGRLRVPGGTRYNFEAWITPTSYGPDGARFVQVSGTGEGKESDIRGRFRARMIKLFGVDPYDYMGSIPGQKPPTPNVAAPGPDASGAPAPASAPEKSSRDMRKVYSGGKDRPPVTRVKGQLYRGPEGSKAKPGSSYVMSPSKSGNFLSVSGDDWTQEWMPESANPGPYETHVRCALAGRRRGLPESLKPTFHNLVSGARELDAEVRKQLSGGSWTRNPNVARLREALKPYYEAVLGRPLRFKHRDIENALRQAIRKTLRENGCEGPRKMGTAAPKKNRAERA